jgi:hypothetical protein
VVRRDGIRAIVEYRRGDLITLGYVWVFEDRLPELRKTREAWINGMLRKDARFLWKRLSGDYQVTSRRLG